MGIGFCVIINFNITLGVGLLDGSYGKYTFNVIRNLESPFDVQRRTESF